MARRHSEGQQFHHGVPQSAAHKAERSEDVPPGFAVAGSSLETRASPATYSGRDHEGVAQPDLAQRCARHDSNMRPLPPQGTPTKTTSGADRRASPLPSTVEASHGVR